MALQDSLEFSQKDRSKRSCRARGGRRCFQQEKDYQTRTLQQALEPAFFRVERRVW